MSPRALLTWRRAQAEDEIARTASGSSSKDRAESLNLRGREVSDIKLSGGADGYIGG